MRDDFLMQDLAALEQPIGDKFVVAIGACMVPRRMPAVLGDCRYLSLCGFA